MKAKAINSQRKLRASGDPGKRVRKDAELTWAQMDQLIEKQVKRDSKILKALAKL